MRPGASRLAGARRWLLGGALVAVAALLSVITPSDDDLTAPFLVHGGQDGPTTARTLSARVLSVTFADEVVAANGTESDGNWLVVELSASAPHTEEEARIALAALHIDGRVFHASEQVRGSLRGTALHVGTDTVGFLAFELADDVRGGEAELHLTSESKTPRLDDVVVLPLPLDGLPRADSFEISEPAITDAERSDPEGGTS